MRFRTLYDFEAYIEKIDDKYEGEDVIFDDKSIEYDIPEFKPVKRSNFGKGTNLLSDIAEFHGNNCYIPTSNNCFLKCINYLTGKDYKTEYSEFSQNENRRKNVTTTARIQPFASQHGIDIDGRQIKPESVKERRKCLYLNKNHFCVIWGNSLKESVEELEANFRFIDNSVSDFNIDKYSKYEFTPKTVESQLNNICIYDIETFNRDRAVLYAIWCYPVSKLSGNEKWNRDLSEEEIETCLSDVKIFAGENCISDMFKKLHDLKGQPKRINKNGK